MLEESPFMALLLLESLPHNTVVTHEGQQSYSKNLVFIRLSLQAARLGRASNYGEGQRSSSAQAGEPVQATTASAH